MPSFQQAGSTDSKLTPRKMGPVRRRGVFRNVGVGAVALANVELVVVLVGGHVGGGAF